MTGRLAREREIVSAVWKQKGLWAVHLVANAVFLFLIYEWLSIPDRTVLHLMLSALSGLAIIVLTLWLHGGTLAHFGAAHAREDSRLGATFRGMLRSLLGFAVWAVLLATGIWFALQLHDYRTAASNWTASFLSVNLRTPVTPSTVSSVFSWIIFLVALMVLPALLLPWGSRTARAGFRGLAWKSVKACWRTVRRIRYWLACGALFVLGAVLPYYLVWWVPEMDGLYLETASLVIRFAAAYILAVTAWLLLASSVAAWSSPD